MTVILVCYPCSVVVSILYSVLDNGQQTPVHGRRTMADKTLETLLDALKQALTEPKEQPLYKSGKLAGLFPGRTGSNGEAAARAVREGLLDVVRTETRGKTVIEWVRL